MKIKWVAMMWLYPRLRELPPETWEPVLSNARDTEFETTELFDVIGGVAFVAWLLGAETSMLAMQPRFMFHLLQFLLAPPLLIAVVGPIYLRRTRRGLNRELARRAVNNGNAKSPPAGMEI